MKIQNTEIYVIITWSWNFRWAKKCETKKVWKTDHWRISCSFMWRQLGTMWNYYDYDPSYYYQHQSSGDVSVWLYTEKHEMIFMFIHKSQIHSIYPLPKQPPRFSNFNGDEYCHYNQKNLKAILWKTMHLLCVSVYEISHFKVCIESMWYETVVR